MVSDSMKKISHLKVESHVVSDSMKKISHLKVESHVVSDSTKKSSHLKAGSHVESDFTKKSSHLMVESHVVSDSTKKKKISHVKVESHEKHERKLIHQPNKKRGKDHAEAWDRAFTGFTQRLKGSLCLFCFNLILPFKSDFC
jgi:hypothetical protein